MQAQGHLARKIVLVVEDEPLLLMMAGEIVEDAGFEALVAHNADEAILILEARADISIVFTDVRIDGRHQTCGPCSRQVATGQAPRSVGACDQRK